MKATNWNQLYSFYLVAKNQSLKKAATEQGTTSSTLSEQLKALESSLNIVLFHRKGRGLILSNEGIALYERIKQCFEIGHKALEFFGQSPLGGYSVQVGIEEALSYRVSSEFLSHYWDLYAPYGTVNTLRQMDQQQLIDNLLQGKIDWGISLHRPKRKNICYAEIGKFEVKFYCAEELYKQVSDPKELLTQIPLAMSYWDKTLNSKVLQYLRSRGIRPIEEVHSDHIDFVQKLCSRGRCIMFASSPTNDRPENNWAIGLSPFSLEEEITLPLYAVWKKNDEGLLFIQLLTKLVDWQLNKKPPGYHNINLQMELSDRNK